MFPIVYSESYNMYSLGEIGLRFQKTLHHLQILEPEVKVFEPESANIAASHTEEYLESLQNPAIVRQIFELQEEEGDVGELCKAQAAQYAGSLTAIRLAKENGIAFNIGGGLHHASQSNGGGFCLYNDITACVKYLLESKQASRILIVDLDAHQGNGYEKDLVEECKGGQVCIFDAYTPMLFPFPYGETEHEMIHYFIPYEKGDKGNTFIPLLLEAIKMPFEEFQPDFVIYNAGTDTLEGDPVTGLSQTRFAILDRDLLIAKTAWLAKVPIMMCMSGGYGTEVPQLVAESIHTICSTLE